MTIDQAHQTQSCLGPETTPTIQSITKAPRALLTRAAASARARSTPSLNSPSQSRPLSTRTLSSSSASSTASSSSCSSPPSSSSSTITKSARILQKTRSLSTSQVSNMPFHAEPLLPNEEIDIDLEHSVAAQKFPDIRAVLEGNRWWSRKVTEDAPETWAEQVKGQAPNFLWIGCADSRVPEVTIMARKPGEVFVQRNVANQFQPKDDASQALLNYAIMNVGVCHVIVVGHTGCGGCIAAFDLPAPKEDAQYCDPATPLTRFLDPIIRLKHSLPAGSDVNDLIRENVKMSVKNVVASPTIQHAWEMARKGEFREVYVHGWLYDLSTGLLIDLNITQGPNPITLDSKPKADGADGPAQTDKVTKEV